MKLAPRAEPYFRTLQTGCALGYRRLPGGKAGAWVARAYEAGQGRRYRALGAADDLLDADGASTLDWAQAQREAREWFPIAFAPAVGPEDRPNGPATVRSAVEHYLKDYKERGGKAETSLRATLDAHVLPALGDIKLKALTTARIKAWHAGLSRAAARKRRAKGVEAATTTADREKPDADASRARRATANRVLTVLKAVLNFAFREVAVQSDEEWRRVRPFQRVDAAKVRFLDDDEARRLANACGPDLRRLVTGALLTGLRYGELTGLRAGDVDLTAGTVHIAVAKGGKPRHVHLTAEGVMFFEGLTAGRARGDDVMVRSSGERWGKSHQHRPLAEACEAARIAPAISFHVLRHTYASRLARAGTPMLAIAAQLGHADTRMTAKHYAHLAPDHVAAAVRAGFAAFGFLSGEPDVVSIRPARTG